jgi:hypothetical protein
MTQTQIDWTKPVQTKETPPRKVRILTTEAAGNYPVVGNIDSEDSFYSWMLDGSFGSPRVHTEYNLENTPTWKLPDPPEGQQWHRNDWTEEMLPAGYRPLLLRETPKRGDEILSYAWIPITLHTPAMRQEKHQRTTRPIPQQPKPQKVQLRLEDVPPGSVIRSSEHHWFMVLYVRAHGVDIATRPTPISWNELMACWEIWRPTDTGWMPCYKEVLP